MKHRIYAYETNSKMEAPEPSVRARFALLLAVAGGAALLLTGCGGEQGSAAGAKEEQLYTCGMHPQVIEHKPGNCPICGMKLTPIRKQAGHEAPPRPNARSNTTSPP